MTGGWPGPAQKGEQLLALLASSALDVVERDALEPLAQALDPLGRCLRCHAEPERDLRLGNEVAHPDREQSLLPSERRLEGGREPRQCGRERLRFCLAGDLTRTGAVGVLGTAG